MSLGLGYERSKVIQCLRAAFGDCDRAMQYLEGGIPQNLKRQAPAPAPATGSSSSNSGTGQAPGVGGATGAPPGAGAPLVALFSSLVSGPQFDSTRQAIIANPNNTVNIISQIAQQLAAVSPQLSQLIVAHPQQFLQALFGNVAPGGGQPGAPRRNQIVLTP